MDLAVNPVRARVAALQAHLAKLQINAVLVLSSDPHLSEYLPAHWQGREWFSGFTGSMGTLVVTQSRAAVFADSRYWEQAAAELSGSGIELVKIATGASTHHIDWITSELNVGESLAVDADVLSLAQAQVLSNALKTTGVVLRTDLDVLGGCWANRPDLPDEPVFEHDLEFAIVSRAEKLASVRERMLAFGATHHLISTVDDVAWVTNLRGQDVGFNPVFLAHLLITASTAVLFASKTKFSASLEQVLANDGIRISSYETAKETLSGLSPGAAVLLDPKRVTLGMRQCIPDGVVSIERINPSTMLKSRKCAQQVVHIREAMRQDGAAMCEFYAWFEAALGKERITELTVDEKLTEARAKRPEFKGLSFSTIAGYNANGALPHYRATPAAHAEICGDGLLLIDSGGQYLGGTTDITRVWPIGNVSAEQKRDYTLVLKGTLGLSRASFPVGTLSPMLDSLARAPLWAHSLEFGHGTGHGVGYFLNVHEGPQSISKAVPDLSMAMELGMVTSVEPGLYRPGRWGIRIENLVLNVAAATSEFGEFLKFETLTMCPIDTRCIDMSLMRLDEIEWLNAYHQTVRERIRPLVVDAALTWLMERTEPIG